MMARFVSFWRNVLGRNRIERDLDNELRAALELLVDERIRTGMSPEAARRAASIELRVESVKEQVREVRAGSFVETLLQDVRYATRLLRRNPLFALTAALSLAIGIGGATTVFTVANGLLLDEPGGLSDADRLVEIVRSEQGESGFDPVSYPDYLAVRERTATLQDVYGFAPNLKTLALRGDKGSERVLATYVTMNFFDVLGVRAAAGRLFGAADPEQVAASPLVVLSHAFWMRRFNGDPSVVGRTLSVNGQPMTVVGAAAPEFRGMSILAPDMWVPAVMIPALEPGSLLDFSPTNRQIAWGLMMGGRLKPGVSVRQASADIETLGRPLERDNAAAYEALTSLGFPPQGAMVWRAAGVSLIPSGLRFVAAGFLALLMALVGVVLIIACANLAGVLLAHATVRGREIAVRLALGAARARLIRQLLTETVVLFVLGGSAGLLLARGVTTMLVRLLPEFPVPINLSVPLDGSVVAFSMGVSLVAALVSGLAPAFHAARADVVSALKDDSQGPSDRLRLRHAFVVAQVAFSILLVVIAAVLARGVGAVTSIDRGFDARGVDVASMDLSLAGYTATTGRVFERDLLARVRALPGVQVATLADRVPGPGGMSLGGLTVPGVSPPNGQTYFFANWTLVDSGYFDTLRIPLFAGRDFAATDREGTPRVAIVGEAAARRLWPGKSAVGETLFRHQPLVKTPPIPFTIVGVVRDVGVQAFRGATPLALYVPRQQEYLPSLAILARRASGASLANNLRALVTTMNPNLPVLTLQTLEHQQNSPVETQLRIAATVAGSVGLIGLLLAGMGIYGVTAYTVTRRTREIGIRLSLGAHRATVLGMVLRQSMKLVAIGSAMGLLLGFGVGKAIAARFGVPTADLTIFAGAAALFAIVGLAACYVPARRAMRIGADALRSE
jgi:predicted permease